MWIQIDSYTTAWLKRLLHEVTMRRSVETQHDNLSKAVSDTSDFIRRLTKKRRLENAASWRHETVTAEICFLLFVWTAPSSSLALAYADRSKKQREDCIQISEQSWLQRYLETSVETLAGIMSGEYDGPPSVLRKARRFKSEYDMYVFVREQNQKKGLAPTMDTVRQHEEMRRSAFGVGESGFDEKNSIRSGSMSARSYKWTKRMQRFRKRWNLRKGTFAPGERLTEEETRSKVRVNN